MDTAKVDLIALSGVSLKKTAQSNGGEWHGPCPFCGGDDRFWVAPNHQSGKPMAFCRNCNPKGWDAIAFIQQREGLNFKAACQYLELSLENDFRPAQKRPAMPTVKDTDRDKPANNADWQKRADKFIWDSVRNLQSEKGRVAREYLLARGLNDDSICYSALGYNPKPLEAEWGGQKIYIPQGVTIPWELGGAYTALRIRKQGAQPGQEKYGQVAGMVQSLYYPIPWKNHPFQEYSIALLVEGEFDAIAMGQVLRHMHYAHVIPCAVGSVTNGRVLANVLALTQAKKVLVGFDADEAGDKGASWWLEQLPNAQRLTPLAHDPNDMLVQLGWDATAAWLSGGIYG